jgi:dihydrolipoamide dehydrogenase
MDQGVTFMKKELVILGGGPGGYVAAIRAAQLGVMVTIIEQDRIGGTCLNYGCIPTKAFYKNAEALSLMQKPEEFGITLPEFNFDMTKVLDRKKEVVTRVREGVEQLLKGNRIEVICGTAKFVGAKSIEVTDCTGTRTQIEAERIIIATGSKSAPLTEPGMDSKKVITSDEALELPYVPKRMLIYGGGVIAVEFAGIFATFGSDVTIIKYRPRLIRSLDEEVSKRLSVYLRKKKIKFDIGVKIKEVIETDDGLTVVTETDNGIKEYQCDLLLGATGRIPNIDGLNLEATGVAYTEKGITVDAQYQTSTAGVYAIGDVTGGQMLAHIASEEGKVCVENMYTKQNDKDPSKVNYSAIPSCVFSFPEVATVGMTEEEAKEKTPDYLMGKALFAANGKAVTLAETDGFIKIIADKQTHVILGVHIIGPHASDLITEGTIAVLKRMTLEEIGEAIHPHPTLCEAFWEAVMDAKGLAIHGLPRPRVEKEATYARSNQTSDHPFDIL